MPKILENEALALVENIDSLAPEQQVQAADILRRYRQQQIDLGEPEWPSYEQAEQESEGRFRALFDDLQNVDKQSPSFVQSLKFRTDPDAGRARVAGTAFLSRVYQKQPEEVSRMFPLLRDDYLNKRGQKTGLDDRAFYSFAQGEVKRMTARESAAIEGKKAALRGEDSGKALAAWQAANPETAKEDSAFFTTGYNKAMEEDGDSLPVAANLLSLLESGSFKSQDGKAVSTPFTDEQAAQLGGMVEQLAGMKPRQRKSIYRAMNARIEAAGYDQKGFWASMLSDIDRGLYRASTTLGTQAGILGDVMEAQANASQRSVDFSMDGGGGFSTPVLSVEEQQQLQRQRNYRERVGEVVFDLQNIVSEKLDPFKPSVSWLNDTIEEGLVRGPGAVLPFMAASAALGPWGAGILFTADFAEQNRRELVGMGMDADQARQIGALAAPAQAAVESLSNMLSLGKFPAVQAFFQRFTKPVAGVSLLGRYAQNTTLSLGTELTEELIQDNFVVPFAQELLSKLESDIPQVDWKFYKDRAWNSIPELTAALLPMALVFGGFMSAADAKLSERSTRDIDYLKNVGFDQAQAVDVASQPTANERIKRAASLWSQRKGDKLSMEEAGKRLSAQYRELAEDTAKNLAELEQRGKLPRMLPMQGGGYRVTYNDGSVADFQNYQEASSARWFWFRDQLGKEASLMRQSLESLEKNLERGRELAVEISPEAMPVDEAKKRGIISDAQVQERLQQAAVLDEGVMMGDAITLGKMEGNEEEVQLLLGMSKNEWFDPQGQRIAVGNFKNDVLRTTVKLWDGAGVFTLVEEKTEGDAKLLLSSGKRDWMLERLRAYEQASGDRLFRFEDDDKLNNKDLIEAWSHVAQAYLIVGKEKATGRSFRRYLRNVEEAGLTAAMNAQAIEWQAVVNRAQKLGELKKAGKLGEDLAAELERQLGIDSQVVHEQEAIKEAQSVAQDVAQDVAQQVDTSGYSEANPGPNGETFSASRAIPADASKVVQMPDGARLVGPTTFSIRAFHGTPHKVDKFTTAKIGTGEGAQAYGWGLYFAEDKTTGSFYRDKLSAMKGDLLIDGKLYNGRRDQLENDIDMLIADAWHDMKHDVKRKAVLLRELRNRSRGAFKEWKQRFKDAIEKAKSDAVQITGTDGNLYTVELLPDEGDFLDWDKPLSEQKNPKLDALKKQHRAFLQDPAQRISDKGKNGDSLYHMVTRQKGSEKAASEYLASIGIPGIRYLDGGSRGAGDGTRNYVIFDENLVRILEENGKPVAQETFSLRVTPAQDAEYMAAVEAGDMQTAQRMVDEAAKAAGYNAVGYRASENTGLEPFPGNLAFAAKDQELAKWFGVPKRVFIKEGFNPTKDGALMSKFFEQYPIYAKGARSGFETGKLPFWTGQWDLQKWLQDNNVDYDSLYFVENGAESSVAVKSLSQLKLADPVTRDESGNVIPLSQRFNPADNRITYSLRPGDFASRVEAMFSPFQRSPEARLVMARVAKDRALRLGNELIDKVNVIRTIGSIDREARVRAALAEDKAVQDYLDGLTPAARQTLEWEPSDLKDDPLVSAMLDYGKLMSKTTALQRDKVDLKMGDFDGAPWLPPSFYSKGSGIMPDQMAQAMFDAGLLPDAYTDTLWAELGKRIEASRKDKTAHREAVQAFKDAKKAASQKATQEAQAWADNAKKQAGSGKAQRDRIKAWLRVLDGILAAAPPEVRARVGGFVKMAGIATDEAALRYLENRVEKLNAELEKFLIKDARKELERIFDKSRPKTEAGEKAKGKLTPEAHAWFNLAEQAAKLSPAVADERIEGIEKSLSEEMSAAVKQELSDWLGRPVTDDAEAQEWQEQRLTIFQTFGSVLYGTDSKAARNAAETTAAFELARKVYQDGRLANLEETAKRREKRAADRADGISRVGSPYDPNKANARKKALNKASGLKGRILDYLDTGLDASGFFLDLLGHGDLYETTRRNILEAEMSKEDAMRKRKADFAAMLQKVFPGKSLVARLRGLWELQNIQEGTPVGSMSQLQAVQLTLWWMDLDSREWLESNGYGQVWQAQAESWLTSEARAVRSWLLKQYEDQYNYINPVFRRLRGVNLPRVDVYGGKRQVEHSKSDSSVSLEMDQMRGGMEAGFTKTRVARPSGPPKMTDALQNYWQNAFQVEHYVAFAETITELKAVFGHRDFRLAVETNRGQDKASQVSDIIKNLEQAGTRDAFAHTAQGKLFGRYGKAVSATALLFKLSVIAKQAPAMIQSMFKVGFKEYMTSLGRILSGKGAIALGDMYRSDTVQRRLSDHDGEMAQAAKGWNQRHFENEIIDKAAIAPDLVMNAGWYAIGWTDARFTTVSAAVAYDVAFRNAKSLGMPDDEAKAYAKDEADLIVMETAQPQGVATKSLFENQAPSSLLRLLFAFQSANRQAFGLAWLAAKTSKKDAANALFTAALISAIAQTAGGLMRMLTTDDEPEDIFTPEAYLVGMSTATLTGIPLMGPVVEFATALFGAEPRTAVNPAAATLKSLSDLFDGKADSKDISTIMNTVGLALGGRGASIGVGWNVLNQLMGLYESATDQ